MRFTAKFRFIGNVNGALNTPIDGTGAFSGDADGNNNICIH